MKTYSVVLLLVLFVSFKGGAQDIKSIKATDLEQFIAESKGPVIINMWATWCQPCIVELPYFLKEVNTHNSSSPKDSITLLLVSLDFKDAFPKTVQEFAKKRSITAPIAWLDETNADYFCPKLDPKWSGAIPATLFVNNRSGYRKFIEEQLSHEELKAEIRSLLQ